MSRPLAGLLLAAFLIPASAVAADPISDVTLVNVSPREFTVFWRAPESSPAIAVFADPDGVTELTEQLAFESFPVHSGSPDALTPYDQRQSRLALRQATRELGLMLVRVSGARPGATYHFRLTSTLSNGSVHVYPETGPLPAVTLPQRNDFIAETRQLLLDVSGADAAGRIVLLTHPATTHALAAVVGDGAKTNQAFFNLGDLFALTGGQFAPQGDQEFAVELMGPQRTEGRERLTLAFTGAFTVAESSLAAVQLDFATLSLGAVALHAGQAGTIPLTLNSSVGLSAVSFMLALSADRVMQLALHDLAPELDPDATRIEPLTPTSCRIGLVARTGHLLPQITPAAQLHFVVAPDHPSAFVPLDPAGFAASQADGTPVGTLLTRAGRIVVVAEDPLLEATMTPDGRRQLTLYGKPWSSYAIESTPTPIPPIQWTLVTRVPLSTLSTNIVGLESGPAVVFYRACEFTADPPLLEARLTAQGARTLVAYGQPTRQYTVLEATRLSNLVTWRPLATCTLTNAFTLLPLPTEPDSALYRLRRE